MRTRIRKRLERWGAMLIMWIANRLPRRSALVMGENLADFAYSVLRRFRETAIRNVTTAFGDSISEERKKEIVRKAFRSLARTMIDFVRFKKYSREELLSFAKRVEGYEHLQKAMKESPGGVIGISSHLGSWEYMGAWLVHSGTPLSAVGKEQPDAGITRMMLDLRASVGIEHIPRNKQGQKAIIRALNSKTVLGLIADQNGGRNGIFVPFFGKMASTVRGPAQLAMRKKVPVIFIAALWEGYEYVVHIGPPIEMVDTGNEEADILENTYRCQQVIERMVRQYPDQWLWGHPRWKTRPPEEIADLDSEKQNHS